MRICERCKDPLVDDVAGYSADGRLVCTRYRCQYVEEINRRIADGSLELVDPEKFKVEVALPTSETVKRLKLEREITAVLIKPLPEEEDAN